MPHGNRWKPFCRRAVVVDADLLTPGSEDSTLSMRADIEMEVMRMDNESEENYSLDVLFLGYSSAQIGRAHV